MVLKKDKQKVLGEVFDDERVRGFLTHTAPQGVDPDFHCLERAYRSMNIENFKTFIGFYLDAGRNLNATNPDGQTILDLVGQHASSKAYLEALKRAA